jgi:uncharacterized peroxidase-related enzyme
MRLHEVEKGDGFGYRMLFGFISTVSGMRLPDAARIVMYHKDFYGKPMTTWTHAAMRGKSSWSVGERELIAAMVAKWNSCPFCIDAHGSIAALELGDPVIKSSLNNFQQAGISNKLQVTLAFLEKLNQSPDKVSSNAIQSVLDQEVTVEALEDAIAVTALFAITVRCANAFNFTLLDKRDSARAAKRLLKQGYVSGKNKIPVRPDHQVMAEALRRRILEGPGKTDHKLRQAIAGRATGGFPIEEPYDELALQIGEAAYKVTDEQVRKVVTKSGSEKAAFELMTTACVSAGLYLWIKGYSVLKETA